MTGMHGTMHTHHASDIHNMLMIGEDTLFLSHLPMFSGNHAFQVLMEASLEGDNDPQSIYARDRHDHPETKMYTLNPEEFVLSDLFEPDAKNSTRSSFRAKAVFRGHLEREPREVIAEDVTVKVQRVIHFQKLPTPIKLDQLAYILFGKGRELFLAHLITRPPDFDQILAITVNGDDIAGVDLDSGVKLNVLERKNAAPQRIHAKEQIVGLIETAENTNRELMIEAQMEMYFEEGELLREPTFEQTEEERNAGF
jgi:hypothetical protein